MKIKLLCRYEHAKGVAVAGELIDVSDDEAHRLADELGLAEKVGKAGKPSGKPAPADDPGTDPDAPGGPA